MGFRTYSPGLNQFLTRDMYNGALADTGLDTDPFTGNRYTFGAGNPISNIELDGHMFPGGAQCGILASNPCNPSPAAPSKSSGGCGFPYIGCIGHAIGHAIGSGYNWLNNQANNLTGGIANGVTDTANVIGSPFRWLGAKLINSMPTEVTPGGQLIFTNHATDNVTRSPWHIGNPNSILYKAGYYGWPLLFPPPKATPPPRMRAPPPQKEPEWRLGLLKSWDQRSSIRIVSKG